MTTAMIRIEDDLKSRVAAVAERESKTAHAFILEAIAQAVEQAERASTKRSIASPTSAEHKC